MIHGAGSDTVRGAVQRQSEAADRQIDAPAYALYGLTAEEVEVVEG